MNIEPFSGSEILRRILHQQEQKNKNSNKKSVSNSTHTRQEFPLKSWWVYADYPCVIHILTSVFQCEGRIIHVCCGQLSPIWTSELQTASEQELWYYMCIKYKKKKKLKHKEPGYLLHPKWAFYPQLCIYWFGVLRGYKVQRWTFLCVHESISKVSTAATGSSGYSLKQTTRQCLSRSLQLGLTTTKDCWGSVWMLFYPTHSAKRKPSSVNMNLWPMRSGGSLCHPA